YMAEQGPKTDPARELLNTIFPLHRALAGPGGRSHARRFNWLGSTGGSNLFTWVWHSAGFKSMDDVVRRELITGSTGVGSGTFIYPNAMNMMLGTRHRIVMGYSGTAAIDLAMERGEVQARAGASLAGMLQEHPDWFRDKKIIPLVQIGSERDKDYPDVPLMQELGKNDEQRQVLALVSSPPSLGRPFFTTPDVPPARVAALRAAFDATMKDEGFLTEARQLGLDMQPMRADVIPQIVFATINAPADIVAKAKAAIEPPSAPPTR